MVLETPARRLMGLRCLTVWTTDGPVDFNYLPAGWVRAIRDHLLADITEFRRRPWF